MIQRPRSASSLLLAVALATASPALAAQPTVTVEQIAPVVWNSDIVKRDAAWYATPEARAIADNVVAYQSAEGGWPKNISLAVPPSGPIDPGSTNTIDNQATTLPMAYLARVVSAGGGEAYRPAFERGLDYLLAAQYANGGWPQFYPLRPGYYSHVTFNDDAMIRVMVLLREVAAGHAPYAFVDADRRQKAAEAMGRGIDLILKTQITQDGQLAAWCAQHDERTLQPAWARKFEPPSLSGNESVAITRFLMDIPDPSPEVIASVEGAVRWFRASAIEGQRVETITDAQGRRDRRIVADPAAGPIWARFYALEDNRPIFLGRDSVVHYALSEIEQERRAGYAYYGDQPQRLLAIDYPAWRARISASRP